MGFAKIKIDAIGNIASDSIEKQLKVIFEGVPKAITRSVLVVKNDSEDYSSSLKCVLPPTAVSDTTSASASVAGDLMSYMVKGLEKLIGMSSGCGEQNMIQFVPSIIALKYLEATNQVTESLRTKAISYASLGYQNQMRYVQKGNSVSFWGYSGGSTWLTAYVALAFKWASSYIPIDSTLIGNMFEFFVTKQNLKGDFREDGTVSDNRLQGLSGKGLAMTAFVSIVLSESIDKFPEYTTARNKALDYIALNVDENNVYDLCISALALHLGGHADADSIYEKMMEKSIETGDELKWEAVRPSTHNTYTWWSDYTPNTFNIEATAYALRVVLEKDSAKSLKAVKYLVSQKSAYGGYTSSQDTVQALYALSLFGSRLSISSDSLNFILTPDVGKAINHQVNPNNSITVQDYTLNPNAQKLDIFSNDTKPGSAIVTLTCKFNEVADEAAPRFKLKTKLVRPCRSLLRHEICISFIDDDDVVQSNMALLTMTFPSGYVYDEDQLVAPIIRVRNAQNDRRICNIYDFSNSL